MKTQKRLNGKQVKVLNGLFHTDMDEKDVLKQHKIQPTTYENWLADKVFVERFNQYLNNARRRFRLMTARHRCVAAEKLANLTKSGNPQTVRKACMDIICQPREIVKRIRGQKNDKQQSINDSCEKGSEIKQSNIEFSPETAGKLLAVLAADKK